MAISSTAVRRAVSVDAATRPPAGVELVGVGVYRGGRVAKSVAGVTVDADYLRLRGFEGNVGEVAAVPAADGAAAVVVGLGDAGSIDADAVRRAAAALVRAAGRATRVAFAVGAPAGLDPGIVGQAAAEGASLAAYRFTSHKGAGSQRVASGAARGAGRAAAGTAASDGAERRGVEAFTVVTPRPKELADGIRRGVAVAGAVALARDLVNTPAGDMTPRRLAAIATEVADKSGLSVEVLDEEAIVAERLGGLAGVARGSDEPPRLIRLAYEPARPRATVALVGKGITFDSGGLSIKSADGMMTMKTDMSGAAAVLAAMSALSELAVPVRVIGFLPATENMPGGRALKPGDVLRARNGTTIEVLNTDAEGRLVLADGLSLAVEAKPDAIVDLATLTGACVVALGRRIAGLMGTSDQLLRRVEEAAARAGEKVWPLPLPDEYRRDIDSDVADIKNIGAPGAAGALAAGLFLREFVDDVPWAHLDIAGPARSDSDDGYLTKGGTGYGVRTIIELVSGFTRLG